MVIPRQIYLDVTSKCNLRCKYCPSAENPHKAGHMDVRLLDELLDKCLDLKDTTDILPWCLGESLMYPHIAKVYDFLIKHGFRWYVTTNGHFFDKNIWGKMLGEGGAYQVIISLDGLVPSTMRICRPGSNVSLAEKTVEQALIMKRAMGSQTDIAVKICERGQDWAEIEDFIQYWLFQGVDFVCLGKKLYGDNEQSMRHYPCQYIEGRMMYILWDGTVTRCFFNQRALYDPKYHMDKISIGDTRSLIQVYNNERYTALRQNMLLEPCDLCSMSYTGGKIQGEVSFTRGILKGQKVYWHRDFYNNFFSFVEKEGRPYKDEK